MTQAFNRGMFLYRGNAVGTGATSFPTKAVSSLPTIGGVSAGSEEDFFHRPLHLTFENVTTKASGQVNPREGTFETRVEAHAQYYTIGEAFHLDYASIALTSVHRGKHDDPMEIRLELPKELHFSFGGYAARAYFGEPLLEFATKQAFVKALHDKGFVNEFGHCFYRSQTLDGEIPGTSEVQGYLLYTPVSHIEWEGAHVGGNQINGHVLTSAAHGHCYVAECYRDDHSLRSNLFRFDLGPVEVETNKPKLFTTSVTPSVAISQKAGNTQQKRGEADGGVIISGVETNGVYVPP